jgi:type II restriction enzyme
MTLNFELSLSDGYTSRSQRARVLTEGWVAKHLFCPACGATCLQHYEANKPVADFYCEGCKEQFELKSKESKSGSMASIVPDGAYATMIERIMSSDNPNLLYLTHNGDAVNNLVVIPKQFLTPNVIIRRNPLSEGARRAGWVGCNINLGQIPDAGKIFIVRNADVVASDVVSDSFQRASNLQVQDINSRGWLMDVLLCVDKLTDEFSLSQMYVFENELQRKHPDNGFVRDKIRQQLQMLRDRGYIEFLGRGAYRKVR